MSTRKLVGRALLVSAFTVTLVPLVGASPAFACRCVQSSDQESYDQADVVFKATVRKKTSPTAEQQRDSSRASVVYEFKPSRAYKGKVINPVRVSTPVSSATCGVQLDGQGPFLVFAYKRDSADWKNDVSKAPRLAFSSCGGTREVGANEKLPFGKGQPVHR